MAVRAVSHVAVGVNDMEKSLAFYRDVLGLEVRFDDIEDFPQTGSIPPHRRHGVYLRWSDGPTESFIVLDQHDRDRRPPAKEFFDLGIHHFGFWVDDIDETFRRARSLGFEFLVEPTDVDSVNFGERDGAVIRTAVLRDPDGNAVQLDQRRVFGSGDGST